MKSPKINKKQMEAVEKLMQMQQADQKSDFPGMGNISGVEMLNKIRKMQEELGTKDSKVTAGDILREKELKILNEYAVNVVQKFGRYIKSVVAFGSSKRQKTSDIDVAVVVDDTDVTRMGRAELKDKLFQRLIEVAYQTDKKIHPQPYLLTEFWEYIRHGNPVFFQVLRTGTPLYDTGFFLPVQMIFKQGLIAPSMESVDRHILMAGQLYQLTDDMFNHKIILNLYQAVVAAGQSLLMDYGYIPPAPREVPVMLQKLVDDKIIDKKWVEVVSSIVTAYKDLEHQRRTGFNAKELETFMKESKEFIKTMEDKLREARKERGVDYKFDLFKDDKKKKVKREGLIDVEEVEKPQTAEESMKIINEGLGQR